MFHWIPDHLSVMAELLRRLNSGAVLAAQMPDNLDESSHRLMAEVAERGPWRGKLAPAAEARDPLPPVRAYFDILKPLCTSLDIRRNTYHHPLQGAAGIVEWMKGAGLKPYLAALDKNEQRAFLATYESKLAQAYPPLTDGTVLLAYPRLFLMAVR